MVVLTLRVRIIATRADSMRLCKSPIVLTRSVRTTMSNNMAPECSQQAFDTLRRTDRIDVAVRVAGDAGEAQGRVALGEVVENRHPLGARLLYRLGDGREASGVLDAPEAGQLAKRLSIRPGLQS